MNRFLALMIYVVVFLGGFTLTASIGLPGFRDTSSYSDGSAHFSRVVLNDDTQADNGDSHQAKFKTFEKKKIKKRYRARWCEYHPTPQVRQEQHIVYDDVVVFCILRSVINERCIRTFGLRGPPVSLVA